MSSLHLSGDRILSRPFPVEWAGWETTTTRLCQCGWKIATQYEYGRDFYRFLFQHEQIDLMGYADWMFIEKSMESSYKLPCIHVEYVARTFRMSAPDVDRDYITNWHLIDGRTQFTCEPIRKMEDFSVFAKLQPKEILIPQADMSVVEQLEAIIRAQEPKQHELRQLILDKPRAVRQIATLAEVA